MPVQNLSAEAPVRGKIHIEGFLDMLSKHRKAWHKRYFRLQNDSKKKTWLTKFATQQKPAKGEAPKSVYCCNQIVTVGACSELYSTPYCFFIVLNSGQETFYLSASSAAAREEWIGALRRQAAYSRNFDPVGGLPLDNALWFLDRKGCVFFMAARQAGATTDALALHSPRMRHLAPVQGGQLVWGISQTGLCHVLSTAAVYHYLAVDYLIESQRYIPTQGYTGTMLMAMDPYNLSDIQGHEASKEDSFPLPSFQWRWLGDWRPVPLDRLDNGSAPDDGEGWQYALSFRSELHHQKSYKDCVRQRQLYRRRWLGPPPSSTSAN